MFIFDKPDSTHFVDLSISINHQLQEKDSDIDRLRDGLRRMTKTVDDQNEKMDFQEEKLQELEEQIKELLEERNSHLEQISIQKKTIKSLKNNQLAEKGSNLLNDEAFELELKSRMKCVICLENENGRCCPVCRKGLCTHCYIRIRADKLKMPCPHCRTASLDWKLLVIPRL